MTSDLVEVGGVEVEADGKRGLVNLPWELLLPENFNRLIDDVAMTELELLEVDPWPVEAAGLFCDTFPAENRICVNLVQQGDQRKSPERLECEKVVPALLTALQAFAAALVKAAVTGPHHVLTITGKARELIGKLGQRGEMGQRGFGVGEDLQHGKVGLTCERAPQQVAGLGIVLD